MRRKTSIWLWLIVVGLLAAGGVGVWYVLQPKPTESARKTTTVKRGTITEVAALSGKVQADVTVEVKSRASGEVTEVRVKVGSKVKAGDVLVVLDPENEERSVSQASANLTSATSRLNQATGAKSIAEVQATEAKARRDARKQAHEKGNVTDEEMRIAESDLKVANATVVLRQADIDAARAQLQVAQLAQDEANLRLKETTLTAPISGTVLSLNVQKGAIVASGISNVGGGTSLLVLGDLETLHVIGALDEADVGKVQQDQEVEIRVDAYPDKVFEGKVALVSPLGKELSNVVTFDLDVLVTDKNADLLKPGMSADLQVVINRLRNVLVVPMTAVKSEGRASFIQPAQGEAKKVKLGPGDGTNYAVLEGVSEGEEIVAYNMRQQNDSGGRGGFSLFGGGRRR